VKKFIDAWFDNWGFVPDRRMANVNHSQVRLIDPGLSFYGKRGENDWRGSSCSRPIKRFNGKLDGWDGLSTFLTGNQLVCEDCFGIRKRISPLVPLA
jgi:hypothetical protein